MYTFFTLSTALLYSLAGIAQYLQLAKKFHPTRLKLPYWAVKFFAVTALLGHTIILQFSLHLEQGINLSFFNTGSLVSWLVALVLLISSLRQQVDNLFIAVFPMAALVLVLQTMFAHPEPKPYALGVISHILLSILAYSIFTLAAFQAVLLQLQNNALKNNIGGGFLNSLPPLQTMERLLFEMLWTGFILLSASLISGFVFVEDIFGQHLVHKSFLSLVSWCVFATLLFGRIFWGWRGHKAIRWTIGGFLSLMLGFFGSKLVLELLQ